MLALAALRSTCRAGASLRVSLSLSALLDMQGWQSPQRVLCEAMDLGGVEGQGLCS